MGEESAWSETDGQTKMSPLLGFYHLLLDVLLCALRSSLDLCVVLLRHQYERRKRLREWLASGHKVLHSKGRRRSRCLARFPQNGPVRSRWYALTEVGVPHRWWVYPCCEDWWERFVTEVWATEKWIENFRMSRGTLFGIVEVLRPRIEHQCTVMRAPIATEKRVAITGWWLANWECYHLVGQQFGVARSTVAEIVVEVCFATEVDLLRKTVCLGEVNKVMEGFERLGFPHCIGALGETCIPVRAPVRQAREYRKHFCSMLLQGNNRPHRSLHRCGAGMEQPESRRPHLQELCRLHCYGCGCFCAWESNDDHWPCSSSALGRSQWSLPNMALADEALRGTERRQAVALQLTVSRGPERGGQCLPGTQGPLAVPDGTPCGGGECHSSSDGLCDPAQHL